MSRIIALCVSLVVGFQAVAVELPAVIGDHLVLQRDMPVPIWGKAEPGAAVSVSIGGKTLTTKADEAGDWRVDLPAMKASREPVELVIQAAGDVAPTVIQDVLVGEVWHCSGQSNMEWPVSRSDNAEQEIASADFPSIRLFTMKKQSVEEPQFKGEGYWEVCSPETVRDFSAVGYFFGRRLHEELDVPVGLIDTAWGGAAAEAYTRRESLEASDVTKGYVAAFEDELRELAALRESGQLVDPNTLPTRHPEPTNVGFPEGLAAVDHDDSGWIEVQPLGEWGSSAIGNIDGVVWMRKTVPLPASLRGKALTLSLGPIDDADVTYVNGQKVGETPVTVENSYLVPRRYTIPASLTESERLVIAVRVFDHFAGGGMQGQAADLFVADAADASVRVPIQGQWKARVRHKLDPKALRDSAPGRGRGAQHKPSYLWNGMIHPVAPFAQRGVIWYQGETNAGRAQQYDTLMRMLIDDWRALWSQPGEHHNFPFLTVQLANFRQPKDQPGDDGWAALRDAQLQTALHHPRTYIATAVDIGNANDIHPTNKQEVGRRLSLIALRRVYERPGLVDQGPVFTEATPVAGEGPARMRLSFDFAEGLTTVDGQTPRGFAVRGAEGNAWQWAADAVIDGQSVIVTAPEGVAAPFDVRYGWSINPTDGPHGINLINGDRLPAFPFRTDEPEL